MALRGIGRMLRSARFRILASMLLVTALGMTVAGVTTYLIQRERVLAQIDDRLEMTVDGLQSIADGTPDAPAPTTVSAFLTEAMQRVLPDHNESILGFVDRKAAYVPSSGIPFRLDRDPAFVALVLREADPRHAVRGTANTIWGTLRYVIIPVSIKSDIDTGLYVSAYNIDDELAQLSQAFGSYAFIALGVLVVVGLVGWFVGGRLLRPIRLLQTAASAASQNTLSERIPVTGNDDVSVLATTFNAMLDRLQSSFAAQRGLLDDVGHELRTPITIVRGHLELLDPGDVREVTVTRDLAIDELDRMQLLVDDIALLAKTDAPGFLRPARVDLGEFADSVLAKAQALAPERRWTLVARAEQPARIDPVRTTQAWLQLAENAVKYSTPGTPIELGCAVDTETVELWVRDRGPGIPDDQLGRVFKRFARVGVGRGDDGSGLGLSIVAAIAELQGGRARAENVPGGARVVIELPLGSADEVEQEEGIDGAEHPDR
ncbi:sensor histidine kinase [Lysinimonas soli]|uniref:histidine kinase n=1 Tax=Lysinimonas soli TaxID=1074233 RepID=A0ABW0NTF6_9MICO